MRNLGHNITAGFEQQGDAVGKPVDRDSFASELATQGHGSLDNERVPLEPERLPTRRGHHLRLQLLHDAQAEVVLPCRAQALVRRGWELGGTQ